ncbi:MAG: rhodanese-like domain-containing protein [Chitinophagaceae bacterium]|nr:rhodanese-like domain-containing protein [Chitinophagaceae bacterium]
MYDIEFWKGLTDDENVLILDIRPYRIFSEGFIRGSIYIPSKTHYMGDLIPGLAADKNRIVVVANEGQELEAWLFDLCRQKALPEPEMVFLDSRTKQLIPDLLDMIILIEPDELAMDWKFDPNLELVDLRTLNEYDEGHLEGAKLISLGDLNDAAQIAMFSEESNLYLYCSDGERSTMAASILKVHGIHNLRIIAANWEEIALTSGINIEKNVQKLN